MNEEIECKTHPNAPHGFVRNASHTEDRYVCECEYWEEPSTEQEPVAKYCCHLCFKKSGQLFLDQMILCPECGNKRCPKATHHKLPCTNSNEPNQAGSVYTTPPAAPKENT